MHIFLNLIFSSRYDNYPTHADKDYAGRVTKIDAFSSAGANFGLASLNITNVTEADRGWYNCKVLFLDRFVPLPLQTVCTLYRMNNHITDLGWVDFDLDVPPTLPSCSAHSSKL